MLIAADALLPALPRAWHGALVDPADLPQLGARLPASWLLALSPGVDPATALDVLWGSVLADLPQTSALLKETVQGYALLRLAADDLRLVYGFRRAAKPCAMVGHLPHAGTSPAPLAGLPSWWLALHAVHDGWYAPKDGSRGHLPLAGWSNLAGPDWLLEPELRARLSCDPAQTWLGYRHGGGGYLGFARNAAGAWQALEVWSRKLAEPEYLADVLARYDAWTAAHLEEMDAREPEG
ncbi:hypothetical protein [Chitinilyticum piscinae]|uniref:Uncharacterized protein n=1 Tax=Chitinilyticum piscinae TaxID=2866724 RepID=A0A8J7FKQ1_9NEIS|nr:hypothetical protein [Chitinilyticum piscinae]MBE9607906.1 hypothetical protein [Chitinilyticum piscinae]